jgi:hypothetical protein
VAAAQLDDGNVSRIVRRLDEAALLERRDKELRLRDPDLLLDAWAQECRFDRHDAILGHVSGSGIEVARNLAENLSKRQIAHAFTGLPAAWEIDRFAQFRLATVYALEGDLAALIAPGLQLASDEREEIEIAGHTLKGEKVERTVPVCGPATFVVLKALAFSDRGEPKDAFDLVYVLRRWPGGIEDIVERLTRHAANNGGVVKDALDHLAIAVVSVRSPGTNRHRDLVDRSFALGYGQACRRPNKAQSAFLCRRLHGPKTRPRAGEKANGEGGVRFQ